MTDAWDKENRAVETDMPPLEDMRPVGYITCEECKKNEVYATWPDHFESEAYETEWLWCVRCRLLLGSRAAGGVHIREKMVEVREMMQKSHSILKDLRQGVAKDELEHRDGYFTVLNAECDAAEIVKEVDELLDNGWEKCQANG